MIQLLIRSYAFVKRTREALTAIETRLLPALTRAPADDPSVEELADMLTQFLIIDSQAKAARELITEYMRSKIREEAKPGGGK